MSKLKPCPFCGSKDINYENDVGVNDEYYISWIECNTCGAKTKDDYHWNMRIEDE